MTKELFPQATPELSAARKKLAPEIQRPSPPSASACSQRARYRSKPNSSSQWLPHTSLNARIASAATPRQRSVTEPPRQKSWKRSGSQPKCAQEPPSLTLHLHSIPLKS